MTDFLSAVLPPEAEASGEYFTNHSRVKQWSEIDSQIIKRLSSFLGQILGLLILTLGIR